MADIYKPASCQLEKQDDAAKPRAPSQQAPAPWDPIAFLGRTMSMDDSSGRLDLSSSKGGQGQALEKRIETLLAEKDRDGKLIKDLQAEKTKLQERLNDATVEVSYFILFGT